jgi:hypothetical protein
LVWIPDGLGAVDAAPLLCAGSTTFNALRHSSAELRPRPLFLKPPRQPVPGSSAGALRPAAPGTRPARRSSPVVMWKLTRLSARAARSPSPGAAARRGSTRRARPRRSPGAPAAKAVCRTRCLIRRRQLHSGRVRTSIQ